CNNKSTHVQTITVKDNSAPVFINVPQDITVYTENYNSLLCEVPVSLDMTGNVTDCQGVGNVTITNNSPYGNGQGNASGTYHVGVYPVKFTAVDKCGNAASVTVNVYVIDNTKPIAKCDDVNLTINNSGLATLNPQDVDEGSTDNCTASQNLILSLSTTQFDCTDLGNNIVTLTVVDQAGNFNTCTSVITVVSNNSTTITLTFSATNESYAGASNASATVVVTGGSGSFTYLWSDPNHTTTPTVNGLTAGFYNVTVTDLVSGCKAVGTVEIKVNPNPTNHKISGTITTTANIPVAQVQVNLTGSSTGSVTTTNNGKYEFLLPVGSNVTVTPLKNINPVNGVTALDLAIIQQHILGGGTLNTPYKLIAADANNDGFINAADLAITQAVILGNLPNFTNNTSWVFVPKSYVFPNPANPFNPAYPKSLSYAPLNADHLNDNYWGIKVGDVEGSANPNTIIGNGPEDREYVGDMNFITTDRVLTEGSTINVDFNTEKFNDILAYQFGMDYNKEYLELTGTDAGVLPGITKSSFGLNFDTDGIITSAWYNATAQNLSSSDKAFRLSFKVKKGGKKLSQVLKLDNTKIQTVGYDKEYSPVNLGLKFKSDAVTNETYSFELFQNQPNP
ncbi:MAG TPA: dockerin type I domain-containing protein, partial [Saprospiraceae bacterium]|nr:dockerin type I domain-containing protein [Saprospiraceae bacterium]